MRYFCVLFGNLFLLVFLFLGQGLYAGKKVKVRILQTTDIHSYIEEGDKVGSGGLLRVASLIKKQRQKWGEDKVLLLDSGDTIQGSISALATRGEAVVDLMNHLKYDYWVLGNHELDFGIPQLYKLLNKTTVPILAGNFRLLPPYEKKFKSWEIVEKNGARICVIGMQASYLKHWFRGNLFKHYEIDKAFDHIVREMPKIEKENPDMIILALHHGFLFKDSRGVNEIKEIAKRFPQIDLILGGHTHQAHPGRNVFGVYYSQAAWHASHLAVIDALIDVDKHEVLKLESFLEEASSEVPKDPDADKVYEKWRQTVNDFSSKTIITLKEEIGSRGTPGKDCKVSSLIAQSIQMQSGADFAIHGRFTSNSLIGEITERDLYGVVPYENFIYVLTVTKEQLFSLMEEQIKFLKSRSFNGPEGFEIVMDKSKTKLLDLVLPFDKNEYTLAVNSRVAAGGGGRYLWLKKQIDSEVIPIKEIEVNSREAVRTFLDKTQGKIDFKEFIKIRK